METGGTPATGRVGGTGGMGRGWTLSILVVEDDVAVAELVRVLLNREPGWGATVVHDAAAAAEVFRHVRVALLVLDVNLPGISGVELLDVLRRDPHWRAPPVVLMTADPDQAAVRPALARGDAARCLAKPFDVDNLVDAVRDVLAHRLAGRQGSDRAG
jgi:two-component system, chemotaxis family, chemotaxis protein CheY